MLKVSAVPLLELGGHTLLVRNVRPSRSQKEESILGLRGGSLGQVRDHDTLLPLRKLVEPRHLLEDVAHSLVESLIEALSVSVVTTAVVIPTARCEASATGIESTTSARIESSLVTGRAKTSPGNKAEAALTELSFGPAERLPLLRFSYS